MLNDYMQKETRALHLVQPLRQQLFLKVFLRWYHLQAHNIPIVRKEQVITA